jgi:hypothetical protein
MDITETPEETLPTSDDELDRHPVMLPLVRLVERAAELEQGSTPGTL